MMKARAALAYGRQRDYFDDQNIIGWTREGVADKPDSGCAIIMSNGGAGEKKMLLGKKNAGKSYKAICGDRAEIVTLNDFGEGIFFVSGYSVSVWIRADAQIN